MQLNDFPVLGGQRLDVDGVCKRRIDVNCDHDLCAVADAESAGKSCVDLDRSNLLVPSGAPSTCYTVAADEGSRFGSAGHPSPAKIDIPLDGSVAGRRSAIGRGRDAVLELDDDILRRLQLNVS